MAESDLSSPQGPATGTFQQAEGSGIVQVGGNLNIRVELPAKPPSPIHLAKVLETLADIVDEPEWSQRGLIPYDVEQKILHNKLNRYREYIEEFCAYFHAVEGAYNSLAKASYAKARVVVKRYLRSLYLNLDAQRPEACGDDIMEALIERVNVLANTSNSVPVDEIGPCCDMIVAHSFIECTVLRTPVHDS